MKAGRLLRLRRADGRVYLQRWGISCRWFGAYLHRMNAPDPGQDLHDHPWPFLSVVAWGGYAEQRAGTREAPGFARIADRYPGTAMRGYHVHRGWLSARIMRLDECHRITGLDRDIVWTVVLRGPARRSWGFYLADGYLPEPEYDRTVRACRRDLWAEDWETVK